ncbi:MAG: transcriptional repressor [Verrucomicrobiota bacterium]
MQPEATTAQITETQLRLEAECFEFIKREGLRLTEPRKVILRCSLQFETPYDAEDLLELSRREDAMISLTTVYRTLPILLKAGIIRKVESNSDKQLYERNTDSRRSIFIRCQETGESVSLDDDCLRLRLQFLAKQKGFVAQDITVRIDAVKAIEESDGL